MPGIGSIHAQAVAMRKGGERRQHLETYKLGPVSGIWWSRGCGRWWQECRRKDRRQDHALAAALDEIAEISRAPILRALREANEENRRLRKLVTDYAEHARQGFEMGQASRSVSAREA